jgi:flagellar basal-body rod protein FlgC
MGSLNALFGPAYISASGMSAERLRMEVVANNIANAFSTRTPEGGPYRRLDVVFSAVMDQLQGRRHRASRALGGVEVVEVVQDPSPGPRIYNPTHPDADRDGFVQMPNVQIPMEMVNLITASRAYEANVKVLTTFRQMVEQAIQLARG